MDALLVLLRSDANAANAFAALASAAAAILALAVSGLSVWISVCTAQSQQKHNELSVRPLAEVTVADYEDSLRVKLRNHGIGPMIVTAITTSNGANAKPTLLEWMPDLPGSRPWTNFTDEVRDRTLAPGSEMVLLELTEYEGEEGFAECRDLVREALAPLTVNVEYTNIYNTVMPPRRKSLAWFGRHREI